jgi:hypothetical protein
MSADKASVERNGAICYNIFKFKNHSRYNLNEEPDACWKVYSNKKQTSNNKKRGLKRKAAI